VSTLYFSYIFDFTFYLIAVFRGVTRGKARPGHRVLRGAKKEGNKGRMERKREKLEKEKKVSRK